MPSGRGISMSPRPAPMAPPTTPNSNKKARKDHGPNWLQNEIFALIAAKREMFFEDSVDARDLMTPDTTKWLHISQEVMRAGHSPWLRDGPACKTKWNQILPDYKRISDYLNHSGRNVPDYWELSATERKEEGLSKHFPQDIYTTIDEWYGNRPQINPPHIRDLLAANDDNYRAQHIQQEIQDDNTNDQDIDDPMDMAVAAAAHATAGESMEQSSPPCSPITSSSNPGPAIRPSPSTGTPLSRARPGVPAGIVPQIISSSDTSLYSLGRRPGNTAVKRKGVSGHTIIAKATKTSGVLMEKQMQDIADSSQALERSKIEVQLQLLSEQMAYQREKDKRLYENAMQANENACLLIIKQGDIVNCLSHLSNMIGKSLTGNKSPDMRTSAHTEEPVTRDRLAQQKPTPTYRHPNADVPTTIEENLMQEDGVAILHSIPRNEGEKD